MGSFNCSKCNTLISSDSVVCYRCGNSENILENLDITSQRLKAKTFKTKSLLNSINFKYLIAPVILLGIFVISIIFILKNETINNVRNASIDEFFYGKTVGEFLDENYLSVTWDVSDSEEETVITAVCIPKNSSDTQKETETFKFRLLDDNIVEFLGTYKSNGTTLESIKS